MQATATYLAFAISILGSAILLPLMMSKKRWRVAESKAHARRLADARMNARLLRLNL